MTNPEETMESRYTKFCKKKGIGGLARATLLPFIRSELLLQHENDCREFEKKVNEIATWETTNQFTIKAVLDALEKMKGEA